MNVYERKQTHNDLCCS